MSEMKAQIESILFAAASELPLKKLAKLLDISVEDVEREVAELVEIRNISESGIHVLVHDGRVELVTNPGHLELVEGFVKQELPSELTAPQLETLTIIAYRGPLTRLEIEQIRGVNCQMILRNLQVRGLVEEKDGELVTLYQVTPLFLKTLGVHSVEELPEYEAFKHDEQIQLLLDQVNDN